MITDYLDRVLCRRTKQGNFLEVITYFVHFQIKNFVFLSRGINQKHKNFEWQMHTTIYFYLHIEYIN